MRCFGFTLTLHSLVKQMAQSYGPSVHSCECHFIVAKRALRLCMSRQLLDITPVKVKWGYVKGRRGRAGGGVGRGCFEGWRRWIPATAAHMNASPVCQAQRALCLFLDYDLTRGKENPFLRTCPSCLVTSPTHIHAIADSGCSISSSAGLWTGRRRDWAVRLCN